MGFERAIAAGKEHRKPFHGAKAVDCTCRNHGSCPYCKKNRMHATTKRLEAAKAKFNDYKSYL